MILVHVFKATFLYTFCITGPQNASQLYHMYYSDVQSEKQQSVPVLKEKTGYVGQHAVQVVRKSDI